MTNSEFKRKAEKHQIEYREKNLGLGYKEYINRNGVLDNSVQWRLTDEDGQNGRNFYAGLGAFEAVQQRYPKFEEGLYSNMLRSEHIPFNLFVPFRQDLAFCKKVFNELMGGCIESIDKCADIYDKQGKENIKIEFAPSPKENYLDDRTSFDTYIEYKHINGGKGIIGIEVKYTEKEYKLSNKSKQAKDINDKNGKYYLISEKSKLYKPNSIEKLKTDLFRQIWRNHLLAESILIEDKDKFQYATSIIFYPKDNGHFTEINEEYSEMLVDNDKKFISVTYEDFLESCKKYCPNDDDFKTWINYLNDRYIIPHLSSSF